MAKVYSFCFLLLFAVMLKADSPGEAYTPQTELDILKAKNEVTLQKIEDQIKHRDSLHGSIQVQHP